MDSHYEPDFGQTQAIFCDQLSDTEFSQIVVHLNVPAQDHVKEAKEFLLKEGPNVIGRSPTCDVTIISNGLSRKHAVIEVDKDSCLIYDTGSQNKTWKGKLLLKPNVKYNLEHNDSIRFGNVKCYVTIEESKEEDDEDTGSETGSESLIQNNNCEGGNISMRNCTEEPKFADKEEASSNERNEPVPSFNTKEEYTQSTGNQNLKIQQENFQKADKSVSVKTSPTKGRRKTMETPLKSSQGSPSKRRRAKLKIMFTGLTDDEGQKIVTKLGGEIVDDPKICTHLVTDKFRRTVKMLCCVAQGIPVVEMKWLEESKSADSFVDPSPYLLKDKDAEKQFKFSLQETLNQAANAPLFQGWSMHATCNVKPTPDQMKDVVLSAGGKYLSRIPARFSEKAVIISCPEDLKLCKNAAKSGIPIVGAEFLLTGLLRYESDIISNQLSVT